MEREDQNSTGSKIEDFGKVIAIVSGVVTLALGVYQLSLSVSQSKAEFNWKKAELSRTMINSLEADQGAQAFRMMDYEAAVREFKSDSGETFFIGLNDVYSALDPEKPDAKLTKKEIFIIDTFDRMFFLIGQFQTAIQADLIYSRDVQYPLNWYVQHRFCTRRKLFERYLKENSPQETATFIFNMKEWKNCPQ